MDGMSIGEVGRRTVFEPIAIRYYERLGLLPKPQRAGGKRRHVASVPEWLARISLARAERMRALPRIGLDCGGFHLKDCGALLDPGTRSPQDRCILPMEIRRRSKRGVAAS